MPVALPHAPQTGFARYDADRGVLGYFPTLDSAVESIRSERPRAQIGLAGTNVRTNPASGMESQALATRDFSKFPELARKRTTLPRVTSAQVAAVDPEKAYRACKPYFDKVSALRLPTRSKTWDRYQDAVASLLRSNLKTEKARGGHALEVLGLSLVPHRLAFGAKPAKNVCGYVSTSKNTLCLQATKECACVCLIHAGNNALTRHAYELKAATARALLERPVEFMRLLVEAVRYQRQRLARTRYQLVLRLNMLSDVPWETIFPDLFGAFYDVQFYDYTKVPGRTPPDNYDLTFSYSGSVDNVSACRYEVARGKRIAAVFLIPGKPYSARAVATGAYPLPETFLGLPVVEGDRDDLRFLDPRRCVVGLRYKSPLGQKLTVQGMEPRWRKDAPLFDPTTGAPLLRDFVIRYTLVDGVPVVDTTPLQEGVNDPNTVVYA